MQALLLGGHRWQVIAARTGAAGYWPVLVMYAVRTGFAGALSTVSTYVAEVGAPALGPGHCLRVLGATSSGGTCLLW
jgi:fluoride ion exporter CrcB/FEX